MTQSASTLHALLSLVGKREELERNWLEITRASKLPLILDKSDRRVFESDRWSTLYTVTVIKADVVQLTLNAGQPQGLSKGTRFSIYLLNTTDFSDSSRQIAIVELTRGKVESGAPAILVFAIHIIKRNAGSRDRHYLSSIDATTCP